MSDYISRADAIEAVCSKCLDRETCTRIVGTCESAKAVAELPSAELTLQTPQTYGKSINPSNAEVVEDYISRADAICEVLVNDGIDNIVDRINALPSADAEWIPCSERLPKKGEVVLITNGKGNVRCGQYRSEHDVRDGTHYWWWKGKTVETVIAWMPLPKPYRKDGEA